MRNTPDDVREIISEAPVEFKDIVFKQLLRIQELQAANDLSLGAIRSLDLFMEPYKDTEFRTEYEKVQQVIATSAANGHSPSSKNQMLANGWLRALMLLLHRKGFLPRTTTIRRGEELLQGL